MNVEFNSDQLTMLATSVELMLGMEMYEPDSDMPDSDFGLTYEGLETIRGIIYQAQKSD